MKLLIITQKIGINDDVLGFMHRWVEEFAKHCEKLTVIALGVGEHNLPENVKVLSLGKEVASSQYSVSSIKKRLKYILNFYKYIWGERKNYDAVFVHMNQEYVLFGGLLWKILNKKIMMWRNHPNGSSLTNLAIFLSDRVFCTSKYSYTAKFKKTEIMPVGIDMELFKRDENIKKIPNSLLYLGRISPIKNVDILIKAVNLLDRNGLNFVLNIVGEPGEKDKEYFKKIKNLSKELEEKGKIKFFGRISNYKTPEIYNQNEIFVNLTNSGSFDKTIFEAMACGSRVLVSNNSLKSDIDDRFICSENSSDIALKLKVLIGSDENLSNKFGKELREYVVNNHSLILLAEKLFEFLK